jgi:hypothetical protein
MLIAVRIAGITPLLVNRFHEEAQAEASSRVHSRKEPLSPTEDATYRLYKNAEGVLYFPAENIRQSIIEAAKRHKLGRRAATTDVAAAVYLTPDALPLEGEWHVDSRPVVIPATQGRILRHRPMFEGWSIEFHLQVDTDLIGESTIRTIVDDSGKLVGIGDFRPARKGPYGRYSVTRWEPMKEETHGALSLKKLVRK